MKSVPAIQTEKALMTPENVDQVLGRLARWLPVGAHLPLVSVILTAYNYERFVPRALESVAAQSYSNFECLVVDDCSTDNTLGEVESFLTEHRDPRFRLLRNQKNLGQLGAQISGFREAHGSFTVFLDADDLLSSDCLATHLAVHLCCEPVAAMTCLDSSMIRGDGELLAMHHREIRPRKWDSFRPRTYQRTAEILGEVVECRVIPPSEANAIGNSDQYYWTTQSFMMFRSDFLRLVMPESSESFRTNADYYLVNMAHAFNTTIMVPRCGGAYRLHSANHYTHGALLSSDQESGDEVRFTWQARESAELAAPLIVARFDRFVSEFGDFRIARALLGFRGRLRPPVFRLLKRRLSFRRAFVFFALAWASCWTAAIRREWRRLSKIMVFGA